MTLNFAVNNQSLSLNRSQQNLKLVADSKNYLVTKFMFQSSEWKKGELVYALFSHGKNTYTQELGLEGLEPNECYVPEWVIKAPGFKVSLVGGDRITTNEVEVKLLPSGYTSDPNSPPPPPEDDSLVDSEELADMLYEELGYKEDIE